VGFYDLLESVNREIRVICTKVFVLPLVVATLASCLAFLGLLRQVVSGKSKMLTKEASTT
jgi:hypothetical protein